MVVLQVFGDESGAGPIPVADSDDVFVAAAVAITDHSRLAAVPLRRSNPQFTARWLVHVGAIPSCAYVLPVPGFGDALARRIARLSTLALSAQRVTGKNRAFVPPGGLRAPNAVWMATMKAAVLRAIDAFILREQRPPDRVEVFLNSKSLNPQVRALAEVGTRELGVTLRDTILRMQVSAPAAAKMYPGAPLIDPNAVTVEWDDAPGFSGSPAGIHLADSLATNMFFDLRRDEGKRGPRGMRKAMADAGYDKHYLIDITPHVVAPIHRETLELYRRDVGIVPPW